jgi:hypothetical protein
VVPHPGHRADRGHRHDLLSLPGQQHAGPRRRLKIQVAEQISELSELSTKSSEWHLADLLVDRRK